MKVSTLSLALSTLLLAPAAFAGILELKDGAEKVAGVTVSREGTLTNEGRTAKLVTVGAGLRTKLGFIKIYVGELLVSDKSKYPCSEAGSFASLKDQAVVAVKMHMLYSITSEDLDSAFSGGFKSNKVQMTPAIEEFVKAVKAGGNPSKGTKIAFSGEKLADGSEVVTYENPAGKATSIKGGAGLVNAIFGLWMGKTDEGGLEALRENFLTCQVK